MMKVILLFPPCGRCGNSVCVGGGGGRQEGIQNNNKIILGSDAMSVVRVGLEDCPFHWSRWYVEEDLASGLAEEIEYDRKKPAVRKSSGRLLGNGQSQGLMARARLTQSRHTLVFLVLEIGERFKSPRSSLGMTTLNHIRPASPSPPQKNARNKKFYPVKEGLVYDEMKGIHADQMTKHIGPKNKMSRVIVYES